MKIFKIDYEVAGLGRGNVTFRVYHDVKVIFLVSKEWRDSGGSIRSIVVCEFSNG